MIWLLTRLVVVPVKAAAGGFKLGFKTGRVLGYRRILLVGIGVALGVLFAPGPGAALRERIRSGAGGGPVPVPTPPRPATTTVTSDPSPVATTGGDGTAPPDAVDVITASGGVTVVGPVGDEPVGEEAPLGVESLPPQVDAEPLPAAPDADPVVRDDTAGT